MKLIAIIGLLLLVGVASANMQDPNDLKITIVGPYLIALEAIQNETTGIWTVIYVDSIDEVTKFYVGNETGFVEIH